MKLIIAGSRGFNDYKLLKEECSNFIWRHSTEDEAVEIVCGMAKGADLLGKRFAEERKYNVIRMPAEWDKYGKKAGVLRNADMARIATHCICFRIDGAMSKGTTHMITLAKEYGLVLRAVDING